MANVDAGDILTVALGQKWSGTYDFINVAHVKVFTVPTPNDDASLLEDLGVWAGTAWTAIEARLSNNLSAEIITVFNITQDKPHGITSWGGGYVGGTSGGEGLPLQDAMLMLMSTAVKRRQGRMYLGGFTEANQTGGGWLTAARSDGATLVDTLLNHGTLPNGSEFTFGVYSKGEGVLTPITTVRSQFIVATQRRRKFGVGS